MQEFSSISVSTYDPDALVGQLNDKAADGWDVVSIVPTGSTITAYLSREANGESTTADDGAAAVIPEPAAEPSPAPEPAPADEPAGEPGLPEGGAVAAAAAATAAAQPEPAPAAEPAGEPGLPDTGTATAEPAPEPAPEPAAQPAAEPAAQAAAQPAAATNAAPAGWYADPSGRFELRYWDGGTWTEHVSRAGQQYTDPPVA